MFGMGSGVTAEVGLVFAICVWAFLFHLLSCFFFLCHGMVCARALSTLFYPDESFFLHSLLHIPASQHPVTKQATAPVSTQHLIYFF